MNIKFNPEQVPMIASEVADEYEKCAEAAQASLSLHKERDEGYEHHAEYLARQARKCRAAAQAWRETE